MSIVRSKEKRKEIGKENIHVQIEPCETFKGWEKATSFFLSFLFFFFFFFCHIPWHVEVPGPGIKPAP